MEMKLMLEHEHLAPGSFQDANPAGGAIPSRMTRREKDSGAKALRAPAAVIKIVSIQECVDCKFGRCIRY